MIHRARWAYAPSRYLEMPADFKSGGSDPPFLQSSSRRGGRGLRAGGQGGRFRISAKSTAAEGSARGRGNAAGDHSETNTNW